MTRDCTHGQLARSCNICDLEQEIASLKAKLAEAEKDRVRLDWIEAQSNGKGWVARESGTGRGFRLHNDRDAKCSTARTAIDAAAIEQEQSR